MESVAGSFKFEYHLPGGFLLSSSLDVHLAIRHKLWPGIFADFANPMPSCVIGKKIG
jgi:hypothetical protein